MQISVWKWMGTMWGEYKMIVNVRDAAFGSC